GDKTPGSKLAVSGSKNSSRVSIEDGTSGITIGHWDGAYARLESSGRPLLITSRDEGIRFGNPEKDDELVLDTNGNVGIGTTEPKAKLDVAGTTRARGLELNPGDSDLPNFVRRLNVLTHRHATPTGKEHTPMHFHIRTPDDKQTPGQMWRYDLRGYAYFAHAPLDLVWVGHYHQGNIVNDRASCRSDTLAAVPALEVSQYTGADGHLYLKFGPILPYMLNFVLDYQCYTERVVHDREGFSVQAREDQENF
ncbi:MAG: hypothetical protein GY842_02950, partial [bacterium]|nr:hypothetical protein [bacterium]